MVLIGMVLALGLLVDVFILMMEGMHEGIYVERLPFAESALLTIRRFALPAFAGQMTTILAMAPLLAISGTSGKFIRILPIASICCLVMSFVVALAIDVPLSRYLLGRGKLQSEKQSFVDRLSQSVSKKLAAGSLRFTLRNRWVAAGWVAATLALFVVCAMAFGTLPTLMYSERDGRDMGITIELPAGSTLANSQRCADLVGEILREKGYLDSVVKLVGKKSPMSQGALLDALAPSEGDYLVGFSCTFTPRSEREKPAFEYVDPLRDEIIAAVDHDFPGGSVLLMAETGKPEAGDPVQIEIIGDEMEQLRELSNQVQLALRSTDGAVDVHDNLGNMQVDIQLHPQREALDFYGIKHDELADQVRIAMSDQEVGKFALGGVKEDLEIRMGTAWPSRDGALGGPTVMQEMLTMRAFRPDGQTVPVMAVVQPSIGTSQLSITRKDGQRSIMVSSKVRRRVPSEVIADVTPKLDELQETWPTAYSYRFGGEAEDSAEAFGSAGQAMIVALFLVFALLVLLFGSFTQPFIIVLTIPMALIGTFGIFFLLRIPFSFTAMTRMKGQAFAIMTTISAVVGTWFSVRDAIKLPPAEAMRPEPPPSYQPTLMERLLPRSLLPPEMRMVVRNVTRKPIKASLSIIGGHAIAGRSAVGGRGVGSDGSGWS